MTDATPRYSRTEDVDEFIRVVERFERGEIGAEEFRAFRLLRGIYGQRQDGAHMLRVKIPGGVLDPAQLAALAEAAAATPRARAHLTTRQNVQLHFLELGAMERLMRQLDEAGLTTRGACGNAVRNVTGCARAGACPDEAFDTTPFIEALTRHFLGRPLAEGLPRKFKIAVSGCASDCALGAVNDLGLIALRDVEGARRFRVLAGGGLATLPTSGFVLHEAYPAERIREVAEALLLVFDRTGDRQNRARARLKFVLRRLGVAGFLALYREELARVQAAGAIPALDLPDVPRGEARWTLPPFASPALAAFARSNVRPTAELGRLFVTARLAVGDVSAAALAGLAELSRRFGPVRTTVEQNLLFRGVAVSALPELFFELERLGLAGAGGSTVSSCPGADSCKLAITNSKALGRELSTRLSHGSEGGVSVKLSGCPNSCGQHHLATIGLYGGVRKIAGRAAPHYLLLIGGHVDSTGAHFGRVAGRVPARRVLEAVRRLLALAEREKGAGQSAAEWLAQAEQAVLKAALLDLTELGDGATEQDFVDLGADGAFRVVDMEGECAA